MKKILLAILILLATSSITSAKEYQSSYGFSINIPSHWLVLTPSELKSNPDLFNLENTDLGGIDKNLLKQVMNKIESGNIEFYFNQQTSDITFSDNINIMKQVGRVPFGKKETEKICDDMGSQLSQYFSRHVNIYQCKTVSINNNQFFMAEFDGAIQGTKSIQYHFNKSPSVLIIITATSKNSTIDIIRREFNNMVNSISLQ